MVLDRGDCGFSPISQSESYIPRISVYSQLRDIKVAVQPEMVRNWYLLKCVNFVFFSVADPYLLRKSRIRQIPISVQI